MKKSVGLSAVAVMSALAAIGCGAEDPASGEVGRAQLRSTPRISAAFAASGPTDWVTAASTISSTSTGPGAAAFEAKLADGRCATVKPVDLISPNKRCLLTDVPDFVARLADPTVAAFVNDAEFNNAYIQCTHFTAEDGTPLTCVDVVDGLSQGGKYHALATDHSTPSATSTWDALITSYAAPPVEAQVGGYIYGDVRHFSETPPAPWERDERIIIFDPNFCDACGGDEGPAWIEAQFNPGWFPHELNRIGMRQSHNVPPFYPSLGPHRYPTTSSGTTACCAVEVEAYGTKTDSDWAGCYLESWYYDYMYYNAYGVLP
ncbi:MAG: hypothetical protein R3B13_12500 [Polyangiaceae bacterium]